MDNQELLKELEKRLPNFNDDEMMILGKLIMIRNPHLKKALEFLKENHPKIHDLRKETTQKLEKKEKENSAKAIVYRCQGQGCSNLILARTDEKQETVCQKCLGKK